MSTKTKLLAELLKKSAPVGALGLGVSDDSEAGVISRGGRNLIEAWHGSPHKFDKFSMDNIGTGEGAQAYGHGLYFADEIDVAKGYQPRDIDNEQWMYDQYKAAEESGDEYMMGAWERAMMHDSPIELRASAADPDYDEHSQAAFAEVADALSSNSGSGSLSRVEIDVDPDTLLDLDGYMHQQPEPVKRALLDGGLIDERSVDPEWVAKREKAFGKAEGESGHSMIARLSEKYRQAGATNPAEMAAKELDSLGIKGNRYKDGKSRGGDGGTSNYVMFDDKPISIVERGFADPRLLAGTAGATGLMAKLIRDSQDDSTVRAPKNPKTAMLATLLRDGERAVEGSPAEFVYPSGLAPWLERLAYDEKPSKLETAMAIADFM